MDGVPSHHLCPNDGEFTTIILNSENHPEVTCQKCPKDSVVTQGGLIYDGKMETKDYFPDIEDPF